MVAVLLRIGRGLHPPTYVNTLLDLEATPVKPPYEMAPEVKRLRVLRYRV